MRTAIVIPARYGSSRFPGKPLAKIAGHTMLERVVTLGRAAAAEHDNTTLLVATEDERIADHCAEIGVDCVMTSAECPTGSDRVLEAAEKSGQDFDFLMSLQGDAPFVPLMAIADMLRAVHDNPDIEVVTPVVKLRWDKLDALRESKKTTPFSGTTAILNDKNQAIWFSKNIIPAIRKEDQLREKDEFSPVYQHLGLYGYRTDILKRYVKLPQSPYETLEGLEQLRVLENGLTIQAVPLELPSNIVQAGIDSPEDVDRAEKIIAEHGDNFHELQQKIAASA